MTTTTRTRGRPRKYRRPVSHDLIQRSPCPTCGAGPGSRCQTPSGKPCWLPHQARRELAIRDGHYQS
jgi:hypothetical protein